MSDKNKPTIFLDLDGTICNFVDPALELFHIYEGDYEITEGEYNMTKWKGCNFIEEELWERISDQGCSFWANLPKYEWTDNLVNLALEYSGGNTFILTSPSNDPQCSAGKVMWIQYHYPELARKIIITPNKYLCAAPDRVLIDDSDRKVDKFRKFGGKGILFPQKWNVLHELAGVIDRVPFVEGQLEHYFKCR